MTRDRRKKASDVFAETTFLFSQKGSFAEAFPQLEEAKVSLTESGYVGYTLDGSNKKKRTVSSKSGNLGEYINCSNPLCYNGGFSVGQSIREMISAAETHREDHAVCQGYEGSPKGRRRYRSCINFFTFTIDLTYGPALGAEGPGEQTN
jgi:hypothetical protein